ncbi:carboxylating nicotinate-nucleotide diphosphorylase [Bacillus taeanensis]|uniref:Probable nicotinate-nucleotide pyrophosphorylase [carboxylating] n=1 Tax=Bacillus taeanensis TaxID=273032 RepID=A0A366XZN3_9BACI|nr:carboxylating nicotinate-nucleotide diphosphorylase [Bacillus taeanensis]RBW71612.1 carboxylating nicotinate-nucleotide diphosphorylase [Bacillus taeanensis]
MNKLKLQEMLQQFFREDIGDGDLTSSIIFSEKDIASGVFIAKEDGVISGMAVIQTGYHLLENNVSVKNFVSDGELVKKGDVIAEVTGPVHILLTGERVILNLLQRMSGIATLTNQTVQLLNDPHTRVCDTRKTTPGLRMLEKYAVTSGGGYNHRYGLYDGVMIKDNHIAHMGSITKAVTVVKSKLGHMVKIEVETETEAQVREAVEMGVDVIMFDNRSPEEVKQFVEIVPSHITTEASGGITLENIGQYQGTGVDYISLGMLTHSARSLDISLNLKGGSKA